MRMRKGFTLIELLIVIIIIGILAAAMLLSSGNSTAAAKAATVINDLRSMKTAAVMFYFASHDNIPANLKGVEYLLPFMDDAKRFTKNRKGWFHTNASYWSVAIEVVNDQAVRKILADKAETLGLYSDWACTAPYTVGNGIVCMKVR